MDFNALQHKLFALDPSDPAEDLRKLAESAGDMPQESAPITESLVQESVEVQQGTMPVEGDYSLSDFAALAGVTLNEDWKDDAKRGWNNYNSTSAIGLGKDDIAKAAGFGSGSAEKSTTTKKPAAKTPVARAGDWKGFLKQYTAQLQKISADPKKKAEFDKFMAKMDEGVEEGDGRKKGIHGKGHPMRKKQQAAIHAGESIESIKEMLYRKLNSK
jgi:hypothetical protein